jgi:Tfp pilus assembly PilM family ATPase
MGYIIGLDVGSHEVKASVFEGSLGRYTFQHHTKKEVIAGDSSLVERQDEAILSLLTSLPKDRKCFVAYPADLLSMKRLSLPFDDQAKIDQTLPFYIEDQIPFEIEDVILSNRILRMEEGKTDLFLSVAPKSMLKQFLERYKEFDIDADILPIDADLLSNTTTLPYEVVLDIGHTRTLCVLCLEGKAIQIRSLSRGMKEILTELQRSFPEQESQKVLSSCNIMFPNIMVEEDEESQTTDALIIRFLQKWSTAVRQVLISFEDTLEIEVSQIQICGGGAKIVGIDDFLSEDLGVPTSRMDIPSKNASAEEYGLSYWVGQCAIGSTHGREFNLRTGEFSYKGNLERLGAILRGSVLVALAFLIIGFSWFGSQFYQLKNELSEQNLELFTLFSEVMPSYPVPDDPELVISLVSTEIEDTQEQLDSFVRIFPTEPPILSKLKAFSEHLPLHNEARIDVSEMKFSKNSINVKAETDQFEQATSIVQELKKYPLFAQAQKSDEKNIANGVRFNIIIPLVQEKEEEE